MSGAWLLAEVVRLRPSERVGAIRNLKRVQPRLSVAEVVRLWQSALGGNLELSRVQLPESGVKKIRAAEEFRERLAFGREL